MAGKLAARLGYDRRALPIWVGGAWLLMLFCYFFMPPPGAVLKNPPAPVNINYVYGIGDAKVQEWMPAWAWLLFLMVALMAGLWVPAHYLLLRWRASAPTVRG